jgi:hypothetical protein
MDTAVKPDFPINGKLYFNLEGAALALKRSEHTIRREISRQRIRFLDYGRAKYFLPEWLDEYIEKLTVAPKKIIKK